MIEALRFLIDNQGWLMIIFGIILGWAGYYMMEKTMWPGWDRVLKRKRRIYSQHGWFKFSFCVLVGIAWSAMIVPYVLANIYTHLT